MKHRYLGSTGIQVSQLCMGTMTFGSEADRTESAALFRRCRDAGINTFDCANVYSQGAAEEILGELTVGCRDELVITSKGWGQMGADINARGLSRRNLIGSVEASLKRLRTSWIDIYFLHRFDPHTPLEETLSTLDVLVRQGKIRYLGASNFAAWQVAVALGVAALHDWTSLACIQPMYNLVKRQAEVEILPLAQSARLGVLSYNPLGGGLLTGKYGRTIEPSEHRLGRVAIYSRRYGDEWMLEAAVKYVDFARANGYNPVSLAVAWAAAHPAITAPIIGARTTAQLEDSLNALDIDMTEELYHQLAALTPTPPPATDRTDDIKS